MEDSTKLVVHDRKPGDSLIALPAPSLIPWDQSPREPHLLDYLLILRKHQWLILTFLVTLVTVVTIATFKIKPVYESKAQIELDRDMPSFMNFQGANAEAASMDLETYMETQLRVLQSETLALQTIKTMDLGRFPEFGGRSVTLADPNGPVAQSRPAILGAFLGRLTVRRIPNSRLLEVTFEAENPQLAAQIINTHLHNFIEQNFRSRFEATEQASKWLASELEDLRVKVEKSEDARIAYERENQIWSLDEKQNITTQKLSDLSKELTDAQADRMRKEALARLAQAGNLEAMPLDSQNNLVGSLMQQQTQLKADLAAAEVQYGPNYPKVIRLKTQLEELDRQMLHLRQGVADQFIAEFNAAKQREELLNQALNDQKLDANALSQKLVEYNILKHDAEANKTLYDDLLQKLKEAGISAGLRSSDIRIVDPAMAPSSPIRPQKTRNILLALFAGLVGGIGLALFREYLDNTVKSPDDVERLTGLTSLTIVPSFIFQNGSKHAANLAARALPSGTGESRVELLAFHSPKSSVSEAFRSLRTSLLLSQADHPPQVLLVTSALPREGKTTAAVNLAVTLAQLGDRTLLVDADLRKPGIRRVLSLAGGKEFGLSSYLAGASSLEEVTVPHPTISNLAAMPTGPVPPNPADLLASARMREAIATLRRHYKFIVIDSPPIMAATDPVILSVLVDGVILVVRSGETPKEAFSRSRDLLSSVKCRLLGVVLNGVDSKAPDYYYSYRYYPYAYGYGYGEERKGKAGGRVRSSGGNA